ncbi:MAG: AraC family transcriptional regulator [Luminiphilus sp.]|nr:AraC family transcriptional regulator [Luminiphilus sp.]
MRNTVSGNVSLGTHYPLYLQKAPSKHKVLFENPLQALQDVSQRRSPDVPVELAMGATGRPPHELSLTTLSVLELLLNGDLSRLRSEEVADTMHISPTTLRRRLRSDGTNYQRILDLVRRHRCTLQLEKRWLPGKCVAWELGYAEVNSFYRAFRRWTGRNYSDLKKCYV